ncbi:MAG: hypothetical protein JNL11_02580 [Bdellovibrionaceae bacterium]|nr:hypothetical protein [Pseudobdellovibrionaceae bacterium]
MGIQSSFLRLLKLGLLMGGCFHFCSSQACQLEGENKKNAKIFYASNDRVTKYNLNTYELKNCQQDVLLTKTVELPSPQNFSTESWLTETATSKRGCSVVAPTAPMAAIFKDPSVYTIERIELSDACIGINVQETQQKAISVSQSKNCQILSQKTNSQLLLKGENCRISGKGVLNLKIDWVVLNTCLSYSKSKVDLNFRFRTAEVSRQAKEFVLPEMILDKKVELLFENGSENQPRYKMGDSLYAIRKSDQYEIDFDFLNLSLIGSKYTQMRVKSEYLVQNNSTQKSPFVLNHNLFLVKNGNYASPILLGRWYTGAYLPGKWMGMDGLSETFNFGPAFDSFELNENRTQIMAGDIIVLRSELLSPNKGPQRFVEFFDEQLKRYQKKNPGPAAVTQVRTDKIDEIKPISGLDLIKLIPEIDQSWSDPRTTAFAMIPLSPIRYQNYCLENDCRRFEEMDVFPEQRVSFLVEEAEIGIKIKPVQVLKRNFKNQTRVSELHEMGQILCF